MLRIFAWYGVPEYWIIDPVGETINVHRLEEGGYVLAQCASGDGDLMSLVVPGPSLRATDMFPDRLKDRGSGYSGSGATNS